MKEITIIIALTLISISTFCQNSLNEKIVELIEISGSSKNYDIVIARMLEGQKSSNSTLGDDFWVKLKKSFLDSAKSKLYDAIIPIYAKYLAEEDVDQIISFYKSTAGQNLINNLPKILQESMDVGEEIGAEIGEQIYRSIQLDKKEKYDSVYYGCDEAKTGDFVVEYMDIEITYNRTKKRQTETYKNIVFKYEIKWLDECRYTLKLVSTNDPNHDKNDDRLKTVNITSCDKNGFKYLIKEEGVEFIMKGEMKKRTVHNKK